MINTSDLTSIDLEGSGVFDVIMRTSELHLKKEFDAGRIRGNDYANVYTNMLQAAMNAAIGYAVQKPLVEAQTLQAEAETINIQAALPTLNLGDEKVLAEIALLDSQKNKVDEDKQLTLEEIELVIAKTNTEVANVDASNVAVDSKLKREFTVIENQASKILSEKLLLDKKTQTECAQTEQSIAAGNSVIGRQLALYAAQTKGYDVDQKVKVAKVFADVANLQLNVNENYNTASNGLSDSAINDAVTTARNSV